MLLLEAYIKKSDLEEINGDFSIDEKIYNFIQSGRCEELNFDSEEWDIADIKELEDSYFVLVKVKEDNDIQHTITTDENGDTIETASQECKFSKCEDVSEQCESCSPRCGCDQKVEDVSQDMSFEQEFSKSIAYDGPWSEKTFKMDIAQVSAFFEVVQFMEYLVKKTEMATPVSMRSAQECQRFILENLCDFDQEKIMQEQGNSNEPIKIKLKDEFAEHLKKWQEESIKLFEERVSQMKKKPEIVKATMMPKEGFNPKGPGF